MSNIIHPTKEEYEEMDRLRFPFTCTKEAKSKEIHRIIQERKKRGRDFKLEERIKKLVQENKEKFFDPRINKEIKPKEK